MLKTWEKNWPELRALLGRGMPRFILSSQAREMPGCVPVFGFHEIDHATFEDDLRFLKRNRYRTLDADGLLSHLTGARPAPERSVVLSFDDGSWNLYDVVYPLLRRFEMKAVAFIAPRFHDALPDDETQPPDKRLPLNWARLAEMEASGVIDCQSHTYEHRYLPHWPRPIGLQGVDAEYVRRCQTLARLSMREDMVLSKQTIERRLSKPVRHLAFPNYRGTPAAIRTGQTVGYTGFWWGVLPGRPTNRANDCPTQIVRLKGEFIRRLPGVDRQTLREVLGRRFANRTPTPVSATAPTAEHQLA